MEAVSAKMDATSEVAFQKRYSFKQMLRASLFGQVVMAEDRVLNQWVAVKLSNMALILSGRSRRGLSVLDNPMKECEIMRRLTGHKHVLSLLQEHYDSENGLHWMVLKYCPKGEFSDYVAKNKFLDESTARHYFRQMLLGLSFLHSANICHLHISLENMLLDEAGQLKICDFGVARLMRENGSNFPAPIRERPGKLRYMAPEILRGDAFDGRKADLFSLGVVLYICLVGSPPFQFAAGSDLRFAMASPGRLSAMLQRLRVAERVPAGAVDLLTGLFRLDPSNRLSLEQVAQQAGITPAALYRYFDDKAHLVRATLEYVLLEYSPAAGWLGPGAVVDATALPGIVTAIADPAAMPMRRFGADVAAASFNDQRLLTQLQELNGQIAATIARGIADGQRAGTVRADLDADAAARFVLVLLAGLTTLDAIDPALVGNAEWSAFVRTQLSTMLGLR